LAPFKSAHLKAVTLLLASSALAAAQQPEGPLQSSGVTLKVTARLTLVDVTVTDAQGKPVHGLTQADFTVKEDGKPQPLRNFQEFGTEILPPQAALPQLPPNVYTNAQPPAPTTSAMNVFLIDDLTTGLADGLKMAPDSVMYQRLQAIKYLQTMPPGTQVAILELTDGIRVVQNFTSDRDILLAAINSLVYKPVAGAYFVAPTPPRCQVANRQSALLVPALEQVAGFLAGIKGRKNVIWFTPGTPWLTNYSSYSRYRCLNDPTQELQRAYGLLTAAQVALYPVDPRGVKDCVRPIDTETSEHPNSNDLAGTGCFNILPEDHGSISDMAKATGGVAYYNRNDLDAAVREAIATGADYYSLSYVPPVSKYDGRYHTINVKVDLPGVHLQYREGYTSIDLAKLPKSAAKNPDKNAPPPVNEFTAAMGHGAAPSTQLLFDVRVTPSTKPATPPAIGSPNPTLKGKPLVRYDFAFTLPSDQITLEDAPDGTRKGSVELAITAYDGGGRMLNFLSQAGAIGVKPEMLAQFLRRPFQVPLQLDLPPGKIFVRVGVRDAPSEKMGTFEIPLTVSK
jgi:VWFA-related protein